MRGAPERLARLEASLSRFTVVHRYCASANSGCDVGISWDGGEPWLDLQLFSSGRDGAVEPTRVEAMFDDPAPHDSLKVGYRLTWRPGGAGQTGTAQSTESTAIFLARARPTCFSRSVMPMR